MWARPIQIGRRQALQRAHRAVLFRRRYSGQNELPHTTYFQPPPPPPRQSSRGWRIVRTLIYIGIGFSVGSYTVIRGLASGRLAFAMKVLDENGELSELDPAEIEAMNRAVMTAGVNDQLAREVPPMTGDLVNTILQARSSHAVTAKTVSHTAQLPSNLPCEDGLSAGAYVFFNDPVTDWCEWGIYDGHAGPRTSNYLERELPNVVGDHLDAAKCLKRPYAPNDPHIINTIKKAFESVDQDLMQKATGALNSNEPLADKVAKTALVLSGSCALFALYDPTRSILRVANVGDSRAVLGRWDSSSNSYVAKPMSVDQTGFNEVEVVRIEREHPGEEVVDPKTGRVHGIAISRAFGDSRWKWTEAVTRRAQEMVFGPAPRPKGVIKTPPYLTAEPEIMETQIQGGEHADFLIMASDGLWDNISSEDAVTAVQMWLEKNKPTDFLNPTQQTIWDVMNRGNLQGHPTSTTPLDRIGDGDKDTYWDENEKCLKWRVSPKHFVVEDKHCGEHLIRNALGGKRQDLLSGVLTIQPPLSRNVRDDITVHVIFFGLDLAADLKKAGGERELVTRGRQP